MQVERIVPIIRVPDVQDSADDFQRVFGLESKASAVSGMVFNSGVEEFGLTHSNAHEQTPDLMVTVTNLDEAYAEIKAAPGISFLSDKFTALDDERFLIKLDRSDKIVLIRCLGN